MTSPLVTIADLSQFRQDAEARMLTACTVRRATGETTIDPDTDAEVPEYADEFDSLCRVATIDPTPIEAEVGARTTVVVGQRLDLPIGGPVTLPGDLAHVTAVGDGDDPALLGMDFEVVASSIGSQKTARRVPVRRFE